MNQGDTGRYISDVICQECKIILLFQAILKEFTHPLLVEPCFSQYIISTPFYNTEDANIAFNASNVTCMQVRANAKFQL